MWYWGAFISRYNQNAFSIEKKDLRLVLETVSFVLEQAVYYKVKSAELQQ